MNDFIIIGCQDCKVFCLLSHHQMNGCRLDEKELMNGE